MRPVRLLELLLLLGEDELWETCLWVLDVSDTTLHNPALPTFRGDEEDVLVRLMHGLFDDFEEFQGVVWWSFDFVFIQLVYNETAEEGVEIEVEVLGVWMCLVDEGFDQVGHAPCSCVEEAEPSLLDLPEEEHRCGFEEQVLGDPLLDGRLDEENGDQDATKR